MKRLIYDAEKFKASFRANSDKEIENLKYSLQMIATEHQVRFSKMHDKSAEVIEELYGKLTDLYWNGQRFVITSENNPGPSLKEAFAALTKEINDAFTFIERHRINLSSSVCALLERHCQQLSKVVLTAGVFGRIKNPSERTLQHSSDAFTKAHNDFETVFCSVRSVQDADFSGFDHAFSAGLSTPEVPFRLLYRSLRVGMK